MQVVSLNMITICSYILGEDRVHSTTLFPQTKKTSSNSNTRRHINTETRNPTLTTFTNKIPM